jgi:hypothetical protein
MPPACASSARRTRLFLEIGAPIRAAEVAKELGLAQVNGR